MTPKRPTKETLHTLLGGAVIVGIVFFIGWFFATADKEQPIRNEGHVRPNIAPLALRLA